MILLINPGSNWRGWGLGGFNPPVSLFITLWPPNPPTPQLLLYCWPSQFISHNSSPDRTWSRSLNNNITNCNLFQFISQQTLNKLTQQRRSPLFQRIDTTYFHTRWIEIFGIFKLSNFRSDKFDCCCNYSLTLFINNFRPRFEILLQSLLRPKRAVTNLSW